MSILELADIASDQWGLFTTAQATAANHTHQALARLADRAVIERVAHGVYRVAGSPPDPRDELRAAWLTLAPRLSVAERLRSPDPGGVVSHRSAAALLDLGDLDADRQEFTARNRRQTRRDGVRIHRGDLDPADWTIVDGLPVTTPERTIRDLAADDLDGGHLATIVRDALVTRHTDADVLARSLRPYAHRYGMQLGHGEELLRRFLDEAGVPESTRQLSRLTTSKVSEAFARQIAESTAVNVGGILAHNPEFQAMAASAAAKLFTTELRQQLAAILHSTPEIDAALRASMPAIEELTRSMKIEDATRDSGASDDGA